MDASRLRYRTIALIAAYAVAMQALLSAFVPLAPAASAAVFAVLCAPGGSAPDQPVHRDLPCAAICAALGHGIAGPLPPVVAVAATVPQALAALSPDNDWIPPHVALRGPQAARAPPLA